MELPKDFYRHLLENSQELVCYHHPDGEYIYVSPSITRLTGYQPDDLIGETPYDFFHPEDKEYIRKHGHLPSLSGNRDTVVEFRFVKKDGGFIWLQTYTNPIKNKQGDIVNLITSSRDITNLVETKDELTKKSKLFEKASEMTQSGAWEIDLETMTPIWSPIVYEIHEVPQGQQPDLEKAIEFYPEGYSRDTITKVVNEAIEENKPFDVLLPFVTAKKNKRWVRSIGTPETRGDRVVKLYGVFMDMTKKVNEEKHLKKLVTELTRQRNQLQDFNQIVSHNLRSPVSNMKLLIDMLQNENSKETMDMYINMMDESIDKLNFTLEDLTDAVKVLTDRELPKEKLSIAKKIKAVKEDLAQSINALGASIAFDNKAWDKVEFPRIYMESIMLNLVSNALKYSSPDRRPVIEIKTGYEKNNKALYISDNGLGIDLKRHRSKLFKLHKTFHRNIKGKGLGLFMTKNQVEAMGGEISVESKLGEGTTFKIVFDTFK